MPPDAIPGSTLVGSWRGIRFSAVCPDGVNPGERFVALLSESKNDESTALDPDLPAVFYWVN